jgi:hypothetical protein
MEAADLIKKVIFIIIYQITLVFCKLEVKERRKII